jgi:hypothetical protein
MKKRCLAITVLLALALNARAAATTGTIPLSGTAYSSCLSEPVAFSGLGRYIVTLLESGSLGFRAFAGSASTFIETFAVSGSGGHLLLHFTGDATVNDDGTVHGGLWELDDAMLNKDGLVRHAYPAATELFENERGSERWSCRSWCFLVDGVDFPIPRPPIAPQANRRRSLFPAG